MGALLEDQKWRSNIKKKKKKKNSPVKKNSAADGTSPVIRITRTT